MGKAILKIGIVLLIALLVLFLALFIFIPNARINAALARARKAGEPLTLEALMPQVTPEQNAFLVYQECFKLMAQMGTTDADHALFSSPLKEMNYKLLHERLRDWQPVRHLLEKAAALPDFRAELKSIAPGVFESIPIDDLASLRALTRFLRADALSSAHQGNWAGAFHSCLRSYRLASQVSQQPFTLPLLVSLAIEGFSSQTIIDILNQRSAIPQTELANLLQQLPSFDRRAAFTRTLLGERIFVLEVIKNSGSSSKFSSLARQGGRTVYASGIEAYGKVIELSRTPYYEVLASNAEASLCKEYSGRFSVIAPMLVTSTMKIHPLVARAEASYEGLKLVIALRIHKLRTGSYPDSMAPLKEILGELPKDPFTGKDFVYERVGEGIRVLRGNDPNDDRKEEHRYWLLDH